MFAQVPIHLCGDKRHSCSYLSEESHVPFHLIWVILLDLGVKHLNDIIHHLTSYFIVSTAGTPAARVLVGLLKDFKGSKPAQKKHHQDKQPYYAHSKKPRQQWQMKDNSVSHLRKVGAIRRTTEQFSWRGCPL